MRIQYCSSTYVRILTRAHMTLLTCTHVHAYSTREQLFAQELACIKDSTCVQLLVCMQTTLEYPEKCVE